MKKGMIFILIFVFLISINLTSAAVTYQVNVLGDNGLDIQYPVFEILKIHESFNFNFHVFNQSNGYPMTNESTNCSFHLFNSTGDEIFGKDNMQATSELFEWIIIVDGGNFSKIGRYSYYMYCINTEDGKIGGFISAPLVVTKTGEELTTDESLIYILLTLAVLGLFLLSLWATIMTPYSNAINAKGAVIKICKLKYVKLGLILLSYVLFVWLLNVLIGVADNFVSLTMYYGLISFLFLTLNALAFPVSIFILILSGYELVRDVNVHKLIKKFGDAR